MLETAKSAGSSASSRRESASSRRLSSNLSLSDLTSLARAAVLLECLRKSARSAVVPASRPRLSSVFHLPRPASSSCPGGQLPWSNDDTRTVNSRNLPRFAIHQTSHDPPTVAVHAAEHTVRCNDAYGVLYSAHPNRTFAVLWRRNARHCFHRQDFEALHSTTSTSRREEVRQDVWHALDTLLLHRLLRYLPLPLLLLAPAPSARHLPPPLLEPLLHPRRNSRSRRCAKLVLATHGRRVGPAGHTHLARPLLPCRNGERLLEPRSPRPPHQGAGDRRRESRVGDCAGLDDAVAGIGRLEHVEREGPGESRGGIRRRSGKGRPDMADSRRQGAGNGVGTGCGGCGVCCP